MVTTGKIKRYYGLSTDTKPTDNAVRPNSFFIELDTDNVYYWDGTEWALKGNAQPTEEDDQVS